jgi:hypothetical protein
VQTVVAGWWVIISTELVLNSVERNYTAIPQYGTCPFAVEAMLKNSGILVKMNALSSSEC